MLTKAEASVTEPVSVSGTSVSLSGVTRAYRTKRGETVAVEGLDLRVAEGEVLGVVGPSGCGKSTLLELLAGLQEPDHGTVEVVGAATAEERRKVCSYMPQRDLLLPWRDALGNAALALESQGLARREARERAAPLFERFGLADFERSRPRALSGGMRQRVALARSLAQETDILLMDEPFGALDAMTRDLLHDELERLWLERRMTVLFVTHNVREAARLGDRIVLLTSRPGRVAAEFPVDVARPRRIESPEVSSLASRVTDRLRAEVRSHGH